MKPVDQTVFERGKGDCLRACFASIFEFPIDIIPNFCEQTQDDVEIWKLVNNWTTKYLSLKCIQVIVPDDAMQIVSGIICIASGLTTRSDERHAVVWLDGILHDPHPSRAGLAGVPEYFLLHVPIDPYFILKHPNPF